MQNPEQISLKALCIKLIQEKRNKAKGEIHTETLVPNNMGRWDTNFDKDRQNFSLPNNQEDTIPINLEEYRGTWLANPLFEGVPTNAAIKFPSIRHIPDLRGYGVPSETLPYYLQVFGFWGYKLEITRRQATIISYIKNPPIMDHCRVFLAQNYKDCLQAQMAWDIQHKEIIKDQKKTA